MDGPRRHGRPVVGHLDGGDRRRSARERRSFGNDSSGSRPSDLQPSGRRGSRRRRGPGQRTHASLRRGRSCGPCPGRRHHRSGEGRVHGDHGTVGLRQVHADARPRRARPSDVGHRVGGRDRDHRAQGTGTDPAPARQDRVHLSDLQPPADSHGAGEHRAAPHDRRSQGRRCLGGAVDRHSGTRRSAQAQARPALGRAAAARCGGPRAGLAPGRALRR